jgi:ferredoxin
VKVWVDPQRCQGHTLCAMIAPQIFELSETDGCASTSGETVPPDQENLVQEAARSCPEQAIVVEDGYSEPSHAAIDNKVKEPAQ